MNETNERLKIKYDDLNTLFKQEIATTLALNQDLSKLKQEIETLKAQFNQAETQNHVLILDKLDLEQQLCTIKKSEIPKVIILKLDLDGKNGLNLLCDRLWITKYLGLKIINVFIFHTTNGYHAQLVCDNILKESEIILFQTWLGSDFRREMCNLLKNERGCKEWNYLFKEKWNYNPLGQEIPLSKETFDEDLSKKVLRLIQKGD